MTHLRFPGPAVARELMDEDDRNARSDLLEEELDAIVGGEMRHAAAPQDRIGRRLVTAAPMVTTLTQLD